LDSPCDIMHTCVFLLCLFHLTWSPRRSKFTSHQKIPRGHHFRSNRKFYFYSNSVLNQKLSYQNPLNSALKHHCYDKNLSPLSSTCLWVDMS
jgi:hypothetical protein